MREKTRKLILSIFLVACIVALMAASLSYTFTNGRYTGGKFDANSPYDDIIDFVGATKYTVSTPEELVNAIENGYSYIEIDKNAPNPFVINSNIADVATNLVLNVNGHIVVRNSRNPLINVQKNVSVVLVYDSESIDESTPEEDMGGFYNPVGSALQASGGTLTVGAGIYESGPDADNQTKTYTTGTEVTLFSRGDDRTAAYPEAGTSATDLPILQGKAVGTDEFVYDYYFQEKPSDVNALIEADTYLIYTEEKNAYIPTEGENAGKLIVNAEEVTGEEGTTTTVSGDEFFVPCNVASCDFYYYYPVADTESTVGSGDQTQTVQTYAVVYGYHDVKGLASNKDNAAETLQEKGLVWPYAAIRSEAGSAYARGGEFHTYFGTVNTYGIYSSGGIMTVGGEASADPEFSARGQGTCIYMAADESGDETDNILTIDSGTFSSEIGDTIKMFGGKMKVKAGTFTKTGCKKDTENDQIDNQTAIISLQGGTLTVDGTKSGDENAPVYSVTMKAGGDANGGTLQNVFGIRAVGGGKITTEGVSFDIYGDYSAGVLSYDGTINLGSDTLINVVQSENTTVLTSAGVSSEQASSEASGIQQEEDHPVNLTGNVTINSNGLGITARGVVNVKADNDNDTTTATSVTVRTTCGTGIYVNNGEFNVEADASILVDSKVLLGYSWATPPKSGTTDVPNNEPNIYNGVYVQGGSLVSNGTLNVEFVGVANDAFGSGENVGFTVNTAYRDFKIKSYAVRVEAASDSKTQVTIASGSITNLVGGGVYVGGGTVTLGDSKNNSGPTVTTTGTDVEETARNPFNYGGNWQYRLPIKGGPAVKVAGGESTTIYGGSYSSDQGDGIVTTGGSCTIHGGTFYGNDSYGMQAGPGASYSFKVYGGTVTVNSGTFGSSNANGGGAFVAGSTQETAEAQINGGSFLSGGQAAFSVLDNAEVTFGENDAANVVVTGLKAGLVLEGYKGIGSPEITINGGTFKSTDTNLDESSAIWAGNPDFTLTIKGGTFTGTGKDGIFIARRTWENNNRGENTPFSGTLKITGGNFTGNTHGLNFDRAITTGGTVEISGDTTKITGTNGSGLHLAGALYATHAVVISGGTFSGNYGGYYGKDGGGGNNDNNTYSDHVNDGLLITGGTFTGRSYGFFFNDNPWSQWQEDTWWQPQTEAFNNVAIVGGTFSSFGANDGGITVGDVFTMHVSNDEGRRYFGVSGSYDGSVGGGSGDPVNTLTIEITFITREY